MKVLYVITGLGGGGAEKILTQTACALKQAGNDAEVLSLLPPPGDKTFPARLEQSGIPVHYLNARKGDFLLPFKLRKMVKKSRPDIVHAHLIHPNILCRLAMAGLHIPLVNTIHTAENRCGQGLLFTLDRLTRPLADVVTAVSHSAARRYAEICHTAEKGIQVIPNGVDPVQAAPAAVCEKFYASLSKRCPSKIFASIGRLDKSKGYALFLERLERLSLAIPQGQTWLFVIFGDGSDRERLDSAAKKLPYPNMEVVFTGFRPDAPQLLAGCDGFFSASLCEGFGIAVAEALTLGLPVVANRLPALEELCGQSDGVFFFDALQDHDGAAMANAFQQASNAPRYMPPLRTTVQEMTSHYLSLYNSIIGGH